MAAAVTLMAFGILCFTANTQGFENVSVNFMEHIGAAVGENVSLPCVLNSSEDAVVQIEWKKMTGKNESKLLVYNPTKDKVFSTRTNVSLKIEKIDGELSGSHLLLPTVDLWDSGKYVCELSTFPLGSIKRVMHLLVTDVPDPESPPELQLSASVMGHGQGVREGDQLKILCTSSPTADHYTLWPSKNNKSLQLSHDGVFIFSNVTRNNGGLYTCQPKWNLSIRPFQDRYTTVMVTIHFLDALECNTSSSVELEPGQSVSIFCGAKASGPVSFTWMKDNVTVSHSGLLLMRNVSSDDAGLYSVAVTVADYPSLQRQAVVNVTVHRVVAPTSWDRLDPTSLITASGDPVQISTSSALPKVTSDMAWTDISTTAMELDWQSVTETFSSENATTEQFDSMTTTSEDNTTDPTANGFTYSSVLPWLSQNITSAGTHKSTVSNTGTSPRSTIAGVPTSPEANKRYLLWAVFPFLMIAVIATVLYMRYRIQRRMDLPPPFKPPPPPVKYTSVRTTPVSEHPMMDIKRI